MRSVGSVAGPRLEFGGLDADVTDEERQLQRRLRTFALEEMRPVADRLDPMPAVDVTAPSSPLLQSYEVGAGLEA